jgi:uncharacterized membrane protein YedE/YeeE
MRLLLSFAAGLLFALGLIISRMIQPAVIVGFLDFFGAWDPSTAFVMVGAIAVYAPGVRLLPRLKQPLRAKEFLLPSPPPPDRKLFLGALLFGAGWGLGGLCPGPALVALASLEPKVLIFGAAMLMGMLTNRMITSNS